MATYASGYQQPQEDTVKIFAAGNQNGATLEIHRDEEGNFTVKTWGEEFSSKAGKLFVTSLTENETDALIDEEVVRHEAGLMGYEDWFTDFRRGEEALEHAMNYLRATGRGPECGLVSVEYQAYWILCHARQELRVNC